MSRNPSPPVLGGMSDLAGTLPRGAKRAEFGATRSPALSPSWRNYGGDRLARLGALPLGRRTDRIAFGLQSLGKRTRPAAQSGRVAKWLVELGRLFVDKVEVERALHALWLAEEIQQELQHSGLRWTTQLLAGLESNDPQRYHAMRAAFDPFSAEFSPYCSLWGVSLLQPTTTKEKRPSCEDIKIQDRHWRLERQENALHAACSRDNIDWDMIPRPLLTPRLKHFDDLSIAPGLLLLRPEGLLLLYGALGHNAAGRHCAAIGQALLDPQSPTRVMRRAYHPLRAWQTRSELPPLVSGRLDTDGTLHVFAHNSPMAERHFVATLTATK